MWDVKANKVELLVKAQASQHKYSAQTNGKLDTEQDLERLFEPAHEIMVLII